MFCSFVSLHLFPGFFSFIEAAAYYYIIALNSSCSARRAAPWPGGILGLSPQEIIIL